MYFNWLWNGQELAFSLCVWVDKLVFYVHETCLLQYLFVTLFFVLEIDTFYIRIRYTNYMYACVCMYVCIYVCVCVCVLANTHYAVCCDCLNDELFTMKTLLIASAIYLASIA